MTNEPVVFLPGLMADARLFGPQIADLSRDHAVMTAPTAQGERIEEIASALLDVTPKRFALAGHGFGGMVAMELLRRAPERVARLALMDTDPLAETPQQAAERDPLIVRARVGKLDAVLAEEWPPESIADPARRTDIMARLMEMVAGLGPSAYIRQSRAMQRRRDQQATLRKTSVPTLILCGAADPLMPSKRHRFLAELVPAATLCELEGVGHFPTLEAPEAVCEALRAWLSGPLVLR